jgi:hypothetical protein
MLRVCGTHSSQSCGHSSVAASTIDGFGITVDDLNDYRRNNLTAPVEDIMDGVFSEKYSDDEAFYEATEDFKWNVVNCLEQNIQGDDLQKWRDAVDTVNSATE